MKKVNEKGFTLAELLIVVAVIAVLVAVAIPTFSDQLEKARQSTDVANLRDAYAVARLAELENKVNDTAIKSAKTSTQDTVTYYFNAGTGKLTRYDASDTDSLDAAKNNGTKMRAQTKVLKIDSNESVFYKYYSTNGTRTTVGPADSVMQYQMTVDPTKAILKVTFKETGKDTFDFNLQSVTFVDPDAGSWDDVAMAAVTITANTGDNTVKKGTAVGTAPTAPSDPYGEVSYAKTPAGPDWITVNPSTGAMTLNKDLAPGDSTEGATTVTIVATDDNGKTGQYTVSLTVTVTDP